jgi:hypothetical protein
VPRLRSNDMSDEGSKANAMTSNSMTTTKAQIILLYPTCVVARDTIPSVAVVALAAAMAAAAGEGRACLSLPPVLCFLYYYYY